MRWPCLNTKRRCCTPVQGWRLLVHGLLLGLLLGLGAPGGAADVAGLYQAQVPVADQGEAERKRAITEAFRAVVVRVAGREDARGAAGRVDALGFVEQFRYLTDQAPEAQRPGLGLLVRFDRVAVDGWLQEQGLVTTGAGSPSTLLWLGLEREGRRELFVPDLDPATAGVIQGAAEAHGLTLVLPLADLEDRARLSADELWADQPEAARVAAQRYRPELVLTARASQAGPSAWVGHWTLIRGERVERWRDEQPDLPRILSRGLERTADILSGGSAPARASVPAGPLALRVSNVLGFSDYLRLREHLQSLPEVRALVLQQLEPDAATFRLTSDADAAALAQSLGLGGLLIQGPAVTAAGADAPALQYRLTP